MSLASPQLKERYKNTLVFERSIFVGSGLLDAYLLIFVLLICSAEAQCFSSKGNYTNPACIICVYKNSLQRCSYTIASRFYGSTDPDTCISNCCSFTYNTVFTFCDTNQSNNAQSSDGSSNVITVTIMAILLSIVSIVICILIVVTCSKRRQITTQNEVPALSAADLQQMDIYQMGPMFMNTKQNCSICLEQNCSIRTRCGHIYHARCLKVWIHKKEICPNCVAPNYNPVILHCTKCSRSLKLALLTAGQNEQALREWDSYEALICEMCSRSSLPSNDLSVSLVSYGEMMRQARTQEKSNIQPMQMFINHE